MDLGGEHPPGVHAVAGEDASGGGLTRDSAVEPYVLALQLLLLGRQLRGWARATPPSRLRISPFRTGRCAHCGPPPRWTSRWGNGCPTCAVRGRWTGTRNGRPRSWPRAHIARLEDGTEVKPGVFHSNTETRCAKLTTSVCDEAW